MLYKRKETQVLICPAPWQVGCIRGLPSRFSFASDDKLQVCRETFFSMSADAGKLDPASYASLDELAALLEVFGLPLAQELARCAAKPLQVCPGLFTAGLDDHASGPAAPLLHCLRCLFEAMACERQAALATMPLHVGRVVLRQVNLTVTRALLCSYQG